MDATFTTGQQRGAALLRVGVGIIFLTAGVQKAFLSAEPWTAAGFPRFGTAGTPVLGVPAEGVVYNPTQWLWVDLAGNAALMPLVDGLVVFGQIAIGVALILGLATRLASLMGTLMMLLFFVAAWEFEHGIVNQHLTYAAVTAFIGYGRGRSLLRAGCDRGANPDRAAVATAAVRPRLTDGARIATIRAAWPGRMTAGPRARRRHVLPGPSDGPVAQNSAVAAGEATQRRERRQQRDRRQPDEDVDDR